MLDLDLKAKLNKMYYSITEVAKFTKLKPHILRYWESEFSILRPKKNRAGNRIYRKKDIAVVLRIKALLYNEGYTIEGAKRKLKILKESKTKEPYKVNSYKKLLEEIKEDLEEMAKILGLKVE